MARLPVPGSDGGQWGDILNEYLRQAHTSSGSLKDGSVGTGQLAEGAVTNSKLDASTRAALTKATNAVQSGELAPVATSGKYSDLSGLPVLGAAASREVGTAAGTVAAGDDSRITGAQSAAGLDAAVAAKISDDASAVRASLSSVMQTQSSQRIVWPQGLVAFWDFSEPAGTGYVESAAGVDTFRAQLLQGVHAKSSEAGPFGPALQLDGNTCFWIPDTDMGKLGIEMAGDSITMIAWVKDQGGTAATDMGFRFGSHTEGGTTPCRQYALYFSGSYYGGARRLSPHIGAQDGATPSYPFNKDFACSNRQYYVPGHAPEWHMEAATYDGSQIIAYLDGLADSYTGFNEPANTAGGPTLTNVTKNPYQMDRGINRTARKRTFTIGTGVTVNAAGTPHATFNPTTGLIGGVALFNRALTPQEIMQVRLQTLLPNEPVATFDAQLLQGGVTPNPVPPAKLGYQAFVGSYSGKFDVSNEILSTQLWLPWEASTARTYPCSFRRETASAYPSLIAYKPVDTMGLRLSQIRRYAVKVNQSTSAGTTRFVVKVGGEWYAHTSEITATINNTNGENWANAETISNTLALEAGQWYPMTVQGDALTTTNLLTDSSFETSINGYSTTLSNTTESRDTARFHSGAAAYKRTWTATTTAAALSGAYLHRTPIVDVTAGKAYTASAWVNGTKSQPLNIQIQWFASDGVTAISSSSASFTQTTADTWQRLSIVSATAPAGAAKARVLVFVSSGGARVDMLASDAVWVDDVMINEGGLYAWHSGSQTQPDTTGTLTVSGTANTGLQPNGYLESVGLFNAGTTQPIRLTDLKIFTSPV